MSSESPYSVTGKAGANNSVLVTLRGDTYEELLNNAAAAGILAGHVGELYAQAFGGDKTEAAALATVQQTFQGSYVAQQPAPVSTVGQLPQPGVVAAPPVSAPPTAGYPGDCAHGPRQFKSQIAKTGRNAGKPWNRWECAVPWSQGAVGRCENVNA